LILTGVIVMRVLSLGAILMAMSALPLTAISQVTLASDGSYVSGSEATLAPDGSYVGGSEVTLAPDGSYVGGSEVTLAPDGSYVGN
jgi:hypothetical protein